MSDKLRKIAPLKILDLLPAAIVKGEEPKIEWVNPTDLYIEEKYQRNIRANSVSLIRTIYQDFKWSHFKPPVCAYGQGDKLFVVDGQHTAIAAASHPGLNKIPVMVVSAYGVKDRATAFLGHNRNRVAITPAQMFYSSLAAGDELSITVQKALDATGCVVVRGTPPVWVEGQTMAAGTLRGIAKRFGVDNLTRVLHILMEAKRAPITSIELAAVADLLHGKEWAGKFSDYDLITLIRSKSPDQWKVHTEAHVRKGQAMQMKRAIAIAWFKAVPKRKK